jgi:hypothetical protein
MPEVRRASPRAASESGLKDEINRLMTWKGKNLASTGETAQLLPGSRRSLAARLSNELLAKLRTHERRLAAGAAGAACGTVRA